MNINKYSIGNYYLGNSLIHKLNPTYKVISLIINIIIVLLLTRYYHFILFAIYLICIMLFSKINMGVYLRNIYTMRLFIIFIIVINLIFRVNIVDTIYMVLKIVYFVLLSGILTFTTPPMEITYGIERTFRVFNKILPINEIALTITLALRFIPTITMQAERIIKAQSLRGIDFNKDIKSKIISLSNIFIPMIYLSLKKADELSDIMEVRLYNYGLSRTNYRLNNWTKRDSLMLILNVLILVVVWRF